MATRRSTGPRTLTVKLTEDDLAQCRYSHAVVKFVGKVPAHMDAGDAVRALSVAATACLAALPDGLLDVSILRSYVSNGGGTQPYAVASCFVVPPGVRDALVGLRDGRSWVELAAPWGGHALLECGADGEQEVHLVGLPVGMHADRVMDCLLRSGVQATSVEPLTDPSTRLPRTGAARALLPASCRLDTIELQGPDGALAVVKVHRLSRLPPAPGSLPRAGSYAGAVAGARRASPAPSAAPVVSAGAATAAAAAAAAPASPRAAPHDGQRGQPPPLLRQLRSQPQPQPLALRRSPSRTRQRSPARGRPAAAAAAGSPRASPGVSPKRQCVGGAASPPLVSPNPFGQLSDVTDMDADAADVAAQLTSADARVPDGSLGAGGS